MDSNGFWKASMMPEGTGLVGAENIVMMEVCMESSGAVSYIDYTEQCES